MTSLFTRRYYDISPIYIINRELTMTYFSQEKHSYKLKATIVGWLEHG